MRLLVVLVFSDMPVDQDALATYGIPALDLHDARADEQVSYADISVDIATASIRRLVC